MSAAERRFQSRQRILGQPVRPIGIVVELAVALAVVAGAGHAVETDVAERLAELRLEHEIAVRIGERLREIHDDAIADVVDPVAVQVSEHPPADIHAGGATRDAWQRPAGEQEDIDRVDRRLGGLTHAVLIGIAAIEEPTWVRR